jgi:hypothetical protein
LRTSGAQRAVDTVERVNGLCEYREFEPDVAERPSAQRLLEVANGLPCAAGRVPRHCHLARRAEP